MSAPEKEKPPQAEPEAVPIPYVASDRGLRELLYTVPVAAQPSAAFAAALSGRVARERLRKFRAAFGGAERPAIELYSLDVALAAGLQTLLAVTEVVMREAMNKQLTQMLGPRWFDQQGCFDYRTKADILRAKTYLGGPRAASNAPPGKVVAALSFGAWAGLLARGSAPVKNSGLPPIDYTATLWDPCLAAAFPQWASDRAQLEALAGRVRSVRNRVAHHEPIVFGVPVHGVYPGTGR